MPNTGGQRKSFGESQQLLAPVAPLDASSSPLPPSFAASNGAVALDSSSERWSDGSDFSLGSVSSATPSVVSFTSSMPRTVPQSPALNALDVDHSQSTIQADRTLPSDPTFSLLRYLTHISPPNHPGKRGSLGPAIASTEAPTPPQHSELAEPSNCAPPVIAAPTPFVPPLASSLTMSRESSPISQASASATAAVSAAAVDQLSEDLMSFGMKEGPAVSSSLSTPTASPSNLHHHHSGKLLPDNSTQQDQSSAEMASQGNTAAYQWLNPTRYQGNPFFGAEEFAPSFPTHHTTYSASDSHPSSASASFATAPAAPLTLDLSPPPPLPLSQSQSTMDELPSLTRSGTESEEDELSQTDLTSLTATIVPVYRVRYGGAGRQHSRDIQPASSSSLSEAPEDQKNFSVTSASGHFDFDQYGAYGTDVPSYDLRHHHSEYEADPMLAPPSMGPFDYVEENSEIILPVGLPSPLRAEADPSEDATPHERHALSPSQQQHLPLESPTHSTDANAREAPAVPSAPVRPPRLATDLCSLFAGPVEETPTSDDVSEADAKSQSPSTLALVDDPHWRGIQEQRRPPEISSSHMIPRVPLPSFAGIPGFDAAIMDQHYSYWSNQGRALFDGLPPPPAPVVDSETSSVVEPASPASVRAATPTTNHQPPPANSYYPCRVSTLERTPNYRASAPVWSRKSEAPPPSTSVRRRSICRYGLYDDTSSESGSSDFTRDVEGYRMHVPSSKAKVRVQEEVESPKEAEVQRAFAEGSRGKGKETAVPENPSPTKVKQENKTPTARLDESDRKLSWDVRTWVYSPVQPSESMVNSVFSSDRNPASVRTLDQWVSEVTLYQAKVPSFGEGNVGEPPMPDSWSVSSVQGPEIRSWVESPKSQPPQQAAPSAHAQNPVPSAPATPTTTTATTTTAPPSVATVSPVNCFFSRSPSPVRRSFSPSRSPAPTVSFRLPHEDGNAGAARETKDRAPHSNAPSTYPVTPLAPLGNCLNFAADGIRPRPSKSSFGGHSVGGSNDFTRRWNAAPGPAFDPTQMHHGNPGHNMSTPPWYQTPAPTWQTPQTPWIPPFPKVFPPSGMSYGYGPPSGMGIPPPVAPMMGPHVPLPATSSLPARTTTLPFYSAGIPTYPLPQQTGPFGGQTPYIQPVHVTPPQLQMQQPAQPPPFTTPGMGPVVATTIPTTGFPHGPRWGMGLHPRFCFPDANVAFSVQNVEYRVHRYFFEQHSNFFRELLASYPAPHTEPIPLVANGRDFVRLLSLFYPSDLSEPEINSVEEWTSILALATTWAFTQLRKRAIGVLMTKANAIQRISISRQYNVKELAFAGYEELCMRSQPVALQDAEELGLKTTLKIWEAQQDLMKVAFCRMNCCKTYVETTIKKKFDLE